MKAAREAEALYKIFDSGGLDKEFFALLQSRAPDDQKLKESTVESEDQAGSMDFSNPAEGGDTRFRVSKLPSPIPRKKPAKKNVAPFSSPKKSTRNNNPSTTPPTSGRDRVSVADSTNDPEPSGSARESAETKQIPEQNSRKRKPLDNTPETRAQKRAKDFGKEKPSKDEYISSETSTPQLYLRREMGTEQLLAGPATRQSPPQPVVQQATPPESSLEDIRNEQQDRHSRSRSLSRLATEPLQPRSKDQSDSPLSMLPLARRQEPIQYADESVAEVRVMSEMALPPPRQTSLETQAQIGGLDLLDNPSSSCGYSFLNDVQDNPRSSEVNSKYFANNQVQTPESSSSNRSYSGEPDGNTSPTRISPPNYLSSAITHEASGFDESRGDQPAAPDSVLDYTQGPPAEVSPLTPSGNQAPSRPPRNKKPRKQPAKPRSQPKASKNISKYFPISKAAAGSSLPFPGTRRKVFGLVQESLAHDPLKLLIATIFLNRTKGDVAIPILNEFFQKYPTAESLTKAHVDDLAAIIHPLGFQHQRAGKIINLANTWLSEPPVKGKRYRQFGYPRPSDGRDVKPSECLDDDDPRFAWEVAHLPGIGPYAIDSWRIFCRDELRGLATDYKGSGAAEGFVPEWKSVLPQDKELRAYICWMWLKEGYSWNMETGEVTPAKHPLKSAGSKNKAFIAEHDFGVSIEPQSAIVEGLSISTPPPGSKEQLPALPSFWS